MKPVYQDITLPNTGMKYQIVSFPFLQSAVTLLTHPMLMQSDNLILPPDTPFGEPPGFTSDYFDDIDSGSVYQKAYKRLCLDPTKEILNPLLFGADATALDKLQKITLEPLLFTFGLLNRRIRNLPQSWRILGFLPDMNKIAPNHDPLAKVKDYHFIMRILFNPVAQFQKVPGGHLWHLAYRKVTHPLYFHSPTLVNLGDSDGHDKWLCKYHVPQGGFPVCRYCYRQDAKNIWEEVDANSGANLIKKKELAQLQRQMKLYGPKRHRRNSL